MPTSYSSGTLVADGTEQTIDTIIDDGSFQLRIDLENATSVLQEITVTAQVQVNLNTTKAIFLGKFQGGADINVQLDYLGNVPGSTIIFLLEQTAGTNVSYEWEILRELSSQTILDAINGLGSASGSALPFPVIADNTGGPIEGVSFVGVPTNTFVSTETVDATYHIIDDAGNLIDIIYEFNVGAFRTAIKVIWVGYLVGSNDEISMQAFNQSTSLWEDRALIPGQPSDPDITSDPVLFLKHTGTGITAGRVLIRFVTPTPQTNPELNTNFLIVEAVNTAVSTGYEKGAIWYDSVNGTPGDIPSEGNGTAGKPVNNMADWISLSTQLGLKRAEVIANSVISFAENHDDEVWEGANWDLSFAGGNSVSNTVLRNCNLLSGTAVAAERCLIDRCAVGAVSLPPALFIDCGYVAPWECSVSGNYDHVNCESLVPGAGVPIINNNGLGGISHNMKRWSGGLTMSGFTATDDTVVEGTGGQIEVQGPGGLDNFKVRGIFESVTDGTTTGTSTRVTAVVNKTVIQDATAAVERNVAIPEGFPFEMVLVSDFATPAPGLTVTVERALETGAYVAATGTVSEISDGSYIFLASAADTDGRWGKWKFSAATAADTKIGFRTFV